MRANQHGYSKMSDLLDVLFHDKKRAITAALAIAAAAYLLSLIFTRPLTLDALLRPVLLGFLAFLMEYLCLGSQLKNKLCTANIMDFFELFLSLGICGGMGVWLLFFGLKLLFSPEAYAAATMIAEAAGFWCATCLVHHKRT